MVLAYNPEFAAMVAPIVQAMSSAPKLPIGDVHNRRQIATAMFEPMMAAQPAVPGVDTKTHHATASDGHDIEILEFYPTTTDASSSSSKTPGPAVLYIHGGGMILGSAAVFSNSTKAHVAATGIPFFSVEYRLAPEFPAPTPGEDCYAALTWLYSHAAELGIDKARIGVMGESAGGGLAAGVALAARDRKLEPPLKKQVLVYPMLDDRTAFIEYPEEFAKMLMLWTVDDDQTGWGAYLGKEKAGKEDADVSIYAAPARAKSLKGLPSTFIDVGALDVFRDEDKEYARRLIADGVDCEFHLYPGLPHAFESLAPAAELSRLATSLRHRAVRELL